MDVLTIETPSLGDRSYVVVDGDEAVVIDPQRDIDRVFELIADRDVRITAVLETHVHNDYVTGGLELARRTGAEYCVAAAEDVDYDRRPVADGDQVTVGSGTLTAIHTPGHTPTHLSWVLRDGDRDVAVFTGGSMLFGSVGRTDLVDDESTESLTRAQHQSVRRLVELVDDQAEVRPTHGFGSFCSSGDTSGADSSTIARERDENQALRIEDEDEFVRVLLDGLDAYPRYYAHMAPTNRTGPAPVDLSPARDLDGDELRQALENGTWVVDLRQRGDFADEHLQGSLNVELADPASTHLAWMLPWGTPIVLLADDESSVAEMQRQLVRVGIDRPAGRVLKPLTGGDHPTGSYRRTDFAGLRSAMDDGEDPWVLDARRDGEWADGHLPGAHHIPLHDLPSRIDEVPVDRAIWVHCASGYRASIAASLLAASDREPVLIDDDFDEHADDVAELVTD